MFNRHLKQVITCALSLVILITALTACAGTTGTVQFVESVPAETTLDLPELAEAADVWPSAIAAARHTIQVASFYYSRIGDGQDASAPEGTPDRLIPALDALSAAAARGVKVQLLADSKFLKTYPEVPALFGALAGAETRILDAATMWDGVLHAKYMLLDDDAFFVGSQNWDWRALDQIHELGVLVTQPEMARQVRSVYDMDWQLAAHPEQARDTDPAPAANLFDLPGAPVQTTGGALVQGIVAASPRRALPAGVAWDLPLLVDLIDSAQDSVHLQLLSYGVTDREGRLFDDLDSALRRAAARRVEVRIILSNWSKSKYKLPWIKSLAVLPHLEVRFTNIPDYSKGFIPFGRVEHAKYLTVDGQGLWIGTSNWSRDYFYSSRNISLFFLGE
ncbi:MAG: phospholipase D-like domain-containing protein, partial [Candidatus Krumholzibacteria bacterium]|nr:phospholipase D-like domain-containing protein [Candidatus Krumholzibacteria bacterium]